ncbi:MAG: VTT domain-containing protein [Pseudobdellovibrionaceae bacterium]
MEIINLIVQFFGEILHLILNLNETLVAWSQWMGPWLYLTLFLIIFAETGLVVTPFLPGDSLLFAVGALTALEGSGLSIGLMAPLLMIAALTGDNVNYVVGKWMGPKVFSREDSKFFNKKHLEKATLFYQKYGTRAIILGRFMPIVRTFVPFVAGVGRMSYPKYMGMSFLGALLWINSFLWAGYFFGNLPAVKKHFHIVIFAVIGVSILPIFIEAYKARKQRA